MKIAIIDEQSLDAINVENNEVFNLVGLFEDCLNMEPESLSMIFAKLYDLPLNKIDDDYKTFLSKATKEILPQVTNLLINTFEIYETMDNPSDLPDWYKNTPSGALGLYAVKHYHTFLIEGFLGYPDMMLIHLFVNRYIRSGNSSEFFNTPFTIGPPKHPETGEKFNDDDIEETYTIKDFLTFESVFSYHNNQDNFLDAFEFQNIFDLLKFIFGKIIQKEMHINKCLNCNKYFIPRSRSDEKYCDRIYRGKRTCKQVGYENKDEFIKAYRTAYKTRNAAKNRNINNNPNAETNFRKWVYKAKLKLEEAREGNIPLEEYREWLKE